ncbi:MAG TPA: hypothetical protein VFN37_01160, partial [Candidatus Baltobacteraceae bacterium]|nr:hypothetical protein [Candidatus Baltobacteraceae bacterium]
MRIYRLLAVAAIASLLSACGGGGVPSVPNASQHQTQTVPGGSTIASRTMVEDGVTMHVFPARGVTVLSDVTARGVLARASSSGNLAWNGGPVQTAQKIYIVFWGSKWTSND